MPRILIIDADARAAQVTSAVVARAIPTAQLSVVTGPELNWQHLQQQLPDALIIDPMPHRLANTQLLICMAQLGANERVLVLSGTLTPSLRTLLDSLGIRHFVEKTAPPGEMSAQLQRMCPSTPQTADQ